MKLSSDIARHAAWMLVICAACAQSEETTGTVVISPATERLSLETTPIAGGGIHQPTGVAIGRTGPVLASEDGLFAQVGRTWAQIDATASRAVTSWNNSVWVARDDGLFVYDEDLTPSPLSDDLTGPLRALARFGDALWISHSDGVDEIRDGRRHRWSTRPADALRTYDGSSRLLLIDPTETQLLDVSEQTAASLRHSDVYLTASDRVFSRRSEGVAERIELDDGRVAWRTVILGDNGDALVATAAAVVPSTGEIWWSTETSLVRFDDSGFIRIERTDKLGTITWMGAASDGSLWLTDGAAWVRVAEDAPMPPVTWNDDIATFSADNCERCHVDLGTAFPLDTYALWVSEVDNIIDVLEAGRMPLDGQPLTGGSVELIEQWKQDGLQ